MLAARASSSSAAAGGWGTRRGATEFAAPATGVAAPGQPLLADRRPEVSGQYQNCLDAAAGGQARPVAAPGRGPDLTGELAARGPAHGSLWAGAGRRCQPHTCWHGCWACCHALTRQWGAPPPPPPLAVARRPGVPGPWCAEPWPACTPHPTTRPGATRPARGAVRVFAAEGGDRRGSMRGRFSRRCAAAARRTRNAHHAAAVPRHAHSDPGAPAAAGRPTNQLHGPPASPAACAPHSPHSYPIIPPPHPPKGRARTATAPSSRTSCRCPSPPTWCTSSPPSPSSPTWRPAAALASRCASARTSWSALWSSSTPRSCKALVQVNPTRRLGRGAAGRGEAKTLGAAAPSTLLRAAPAPAPVTAS